MLVEIQCDKFKSHGKKRKPVTFGKGLNAVLGDDKATNSIGKSSFLLVIDFAFGGEDYSKSDAVSQIAEHTINFAFEFDGQRYYFCRNAINHRTVGVCADNKYVATEYISLDEYRARLKKLYKIEIPRLSFREMLGRHFRAQGRGNCNHEEPLLADPKEKYETAITSLIKLFGRYNFFEDLRATLKATSEHFNAYKAAQKMEFIPNVTSKTQYTNNEKAIQRLRDEMSDLISNSDRRLEAEDLARSNEAAEIKGALSKARRQRAAFVSRLNGLERVFHNGAVMTENELAELAGYFPELNLRLLRDIERFHALQEQSLKESRAADIAHLKELIEVSDKAIAKLEEEQRELGIPVKLSRTFLDEHAKLNAQMTRVNDIVYSNKRKPPILTLSAMNKCNFETPRDTGTGTSYKSLIVYDLSILAITDLPAILHDSLLLKNIGDTPTERIIELYAQSEKQIFIAFDRVGIYDERTRELLNAAAVLRLAPGGDELFGYSWAEDEE